MRATAHATSAIRVTTATGRRTELPFHYTLGYRLPAIVQAGALRCSKDDLPYEGEAVWCSLRADWEPAANPSAIDPITGRVVPWLSRWEAAYYCRGLVRIEVAPESAPHRFEEFLSSGRCHPEYVNTARANDLTRRDRSLWRLSYIDIPSEMYDFQRERELYRVPVLLGELIARLGVASIRTLDVLDLGCGTGLMARIVGLYAKRLVGVDCSSGMLAQARSRGYHELIHADIIEYLRGATSTSTSQAFDLIVAADTFCYFAALDDVISLAARALKPGGALIFTLHDALTVDLPDGFARMPGRYVHRHRAEYVARVLKAAGLRPEITSALLRMVPATVRGCWCARRTRTIRQRRHDGA